MNAAFYVVDESALPRFEADVQPAAVISAIEEVGGAWGEVETTANDVEAVFRVLDRLVDDDGTDYLAAIAFVGSPDLVLTGKPGPWRLGWFEASLVQSLQPVIDALEDEIADQINAAAPTAREVFNGFRDALEEAKLRGFALAIAYGV